MSFNNTKCPCGGRKEPQTFLCPACVIAFSDRPEMSDYMDERLGLDLRRDAAFVLLSLAKKRRIGYGPGKLN